MKIVTLTPRHALYRQGMRAAFRWDNEYANWDQIDAVRSVLIKELGFGGIGLPENFMDDLPEVEWQERPGHYTKGRRRVYWIGVRNPAVPTFILLKYPDIANIEPNEIIYDDIMETV